MAGSHFVSKLAQYRLDSGLSLKEVSELTGINDKVLNNWERGVTREFGPRTNFNHVRELCSLYGIEFNAITFEALLEEAYQRGKKGQGEWNGIETPEIQKKEEPKVTSEVPKKEISESKENTTMNERVSIGAPSPKSTENTKKMVDEILNEKPATLSRANPKYSAEELETFLDNLYGKISRKDFAIAEYLVRRAI